MFISIKGWGLLYMWWWLLDKFPHVRSDSKILSFQIHSVIHGQQDAPTPWNYPIVAHVARLKARLSSGKASKEISTFSFLETSYTGKIPFTLKAKWKKYEGKKKKKTTKKWLNFHKLTKSHVQYKWGNTEFRAEIYKTFYFNYSFKHLSSFCLKISYT